MACNTLLSSVASPSALGLSSASTVFVGAPSNVAPLSSLCVVKPLAITCSAASDKEPALPKARNAVLAGLVAAGAALSVFTAGTVAPVQAAVGPGGSGAERTAVKAQELLKSADKLNREEAPPRFGPGRIAGSAEDAGKVAQDAGGKALSNITGGVSELGSLSLEFNKGDLQGAAEDVTSRVKGGADQATSGGDGLFGAIKDSLQGVKENVESKNAEAKRTLDEATNKVQTSVQ